MKPQPFFRCLAYGLLVRKFTGAVLLAYWSIGRLEAGIRMAAKGGKSRQALRNIAAFAARAYMASDCRRAPE